ncbi:hypothetical protein D3C84_1107170 [compost metagenome]
MKLVEVSVRIELKMIGLLHFGASGGFEEARRGDTGTWNPRCHSGSTLTQIDRQSLYAN